MNSPPASSGISSKPSSSNRPDAAAEAIASFEQVNVGAASDQVARRGQTRQSAADTSTRAPLSDVDVSESGTTR